MPIGTKQLRVAAELAKGTPHGEIERMGLCNTATVWKWQQKPEFCDAVAVLSKLRLDSRIESATEDADELEQIKGQEVKLNESLAEISSKLVELNGKILDHALTLDPETLGIRILPQTIKALRDAVELQRTGADRIAAVEDILNELKAAEKAIEKRNLHILKPAKDASAQEPVREGRGDKGIRGT